MSDALSFAPLDDLVAALDAADVQASLDPSELNLPGAWVTVEDITPSTLEGGWDINAVVFLVAADVDHTRAAAALAELFNKATAGGVQPDGPVVPQGVIMPGDPTPLPALRVPVTVTTSTA